MVKKRNSLFPQDSSAFLISSNLSPDIESDLFGISSHDKQSIISQHTFPIVQPPSPSGPQSPHSIMDSLGGNLHQLNSSQINKLIDVKYHGDPILLIKQLSLDLARKESELVLLRQEKFTNEQRLIRLCNEYGNLSTLEIHHKLNEQQDDMNQLQPHEVDGVIKDMIGSAVHDDISAKSSPIKPQLLKHSRSSEKSDQAKHSGDLQSATSPNKPGSFYKQSNKSWLRNWFNSSEDLSRSASYSNVPSVSSSNSIVKGQVKGHSRPHSRSLTHFKRTPEPSSFHIPEKDPVEMEDIKVNGTSLEISHSGTSADDVHIDKYGFFTDIDNFRKPQNGIRSSSLGSTTPSEKASFKSPVLKNSESSNSSLKTPPIPPATSNSPNTSLLNFTDNGPGKNVSTPASAISEINHASTSPVDATQPSTKPDPSLGIFVGNKNRSQTIHQLKEIGKIHDSISLHIESQWDILMREIEKDFYTFSKDKGSDVGFDTIIGIRGLNLIEIDNYNDKGLIKRKTDYYSRLISLTTHLGIPSKYRFKLWLQLSGGKYLRVNGEYNELLNEAKYAEDSHESEDSDKAPVERSQIIYHNIKQIKLDLHRTLPRNYYFNNLVELKPGPNYYKLQRILYAFVAYRPDIGYLQGMNKIVGNLLLLLIKIDGAGTSSDAHEKYTEEDIFWIFIGLIEEILPTYSSEFKRVDSKPVRAEHKETFFNSLLKIREDQIIMSKFYMSYSLPQLTSHFKELGFEIELVTMNWWLTLFIDLKFLDLDTWFKMFDYLLIGDPVESGMISGEEIQLLRNSSEQSITDVKKAVKLITLTMSILKCLEPILLGMNDRDILYEYLNSNNPRMYENGTTGSIKYTDMMKHNSEFTKSVKWGDLKSYRDEIMKISSSI